jgi:hypothetical protein|mmetsp:Transcript_59153/g.97293  ORF Transcript_59153/g.97293 Transcript_59153/m.97293 type:complete len:234 (-) Transcript_59153:736-1437(-)
MARGANTDALSGTDSHGPKAAAADVAKFAAAAAPPRISAGAAKLPPRGPIELAALSAAAEMLPTPPLVLARGCLSVHIRQSIAGFALPLARVSCLKDSLSWCRLILSDIVPEIPGSLTSEHPDPVTPPEPCQPHASALPSRGAASCWLIVWNGLAPDNRGVGPPVPGDGSSSLSSAPWAGAGPASSCVNRSVSASPGDARCGLGGRLLLAPASSEIRWPAVGISPCWAPVPEG